ncbi:MAG: hypothetical protein QOE62_646 [Actinomycetota bacterium]|jgi:hypothetical protein|nr:hypothetical protein [Actinomycetota bacterium]
MHIRDAERLFVLLSSARESVFAGSPSVGVRIAGTASTSLLVPRHDNRQPAAWLMRQGRPKQDTAPRKLTTSTAHNTREACSRTTKCLTQACVARPAGTGTHDEIVTISLRKVLRTSFTRFGAPPRRKQETIGELDPISP